MNENALERLDAALSGRYKVEREVGEGGMAKVYLAHDLRHGRSVALKVLKPDLAAVVGAERFLAEIRTTANLQHPHILPLYDSGEADGFLFYVMPYVEGETLRERLNREKQLAVEDALRIAAAVAGALDYAHQRGVVHRDIKPGNILMQAGQPVVADFGIASSKKRSNTVWERDQDDRAMRSASTKSSRSHPRMCAPSPGQCSVACCECSGGGGSLLKSQPMT
jgi:serine/threonine-protein kinase